MAKHPNDPEGPLTRSIPNERIMQAAKWFAAHGDERLRAVVPTIRAAFPDLSPLQCIKAAQYARENMSGGAGHCDG